MPGQLRIRVRHRHYVTPWFDYLFVSRDELRQLAEQGGWRVTRFLPETGALYIALLEPAESRRADTSHQRHVPRSV